MLRPVSLLPALVVVATLLGIPLGAAEAAAPHRADEAPLAVTMDNLAPSAIPRKGPVRVSGSVTNRDDQTWTSIKLYGFVSSTPMTTTAELADAARTDPSLYVGDRILTAGTYDAVDELEPGETAQYSVTIPRSELPDEAGVYWFGVHALGFNADGGDNFADGRARTFIPLVPPTRKTVDTALVVPVRAHVRHRADGSLTSPRSWAHSLSPGGRLRSLVDFGTAAGSRPITWLLDPAVPDAVERLVTGNPPRSLDPTVAEEGDGSPSPSPTTEPSDGSSTGPTTDDGGDGADPAVTAASEAGAAWLDRLHEGLTSSEILTLPYGDVDVAGAAEHDPATYRTARKRSSGDLPPWDLPTRPAVASPSGYLDAAGIRMTERAATTIVSDQMLSDDSGDPVPPLVRVDGHTLVVASSGAASGGPGPDDPLAPLAMRQRILSEAALRLLTPGRPPLVVVLPTDWAPQTTAGFFEGLDVDWVRMTTVADVARGRATDVPADRLTYPEDEQRRELGATAFDSANDLTEAGDTLQNLLTRNDRVATEVGDEALTDTSYSDRRRPQAAGAAANRSRRWIEGKLQSVRIDAPKAVILSSGSGRFSATIRNGLDQPVTVRVQAIADRPLKVAAPADSIDLGPQTRTTVLLDASSSAIGIRNVTLVLTDVADVPLGSSDDLPIRSNRVSNVIWLILGAGVALLFGAIVVRLFRRILAAARS